MSELTCIVCPIGCSLLIEESAAGADGSPALTVTGNRCARGAAYAQEEIRAPKRVVTATCGIAPASGDSDAMSRQSFTAPRRIPVKSSVPCPKELIPELLEDIYRLNLSLPVKVGDRPVINWKDSGIDVVVVRDL